MVGSTLFGRLSAAVMAAAALPAAVTAAAPVTAQAPTRAEAFSVQLIAPPKAAVGDLVAVDVRAHGVPQLAGFELTGTVAPDAGTIEIADADVKSNVTGTREDM